MARKQKIGSSLVLTAAVMLSGCVELKTVVTVEKDGSGTVEQTVYYPEVDANAPGISFGVQGEEGNGSNFGGPVKQPTEAEKLAATRAQAEKAAAKMGEGVTLRTVEPLPPRNGRKGVRIVYAFKDINKLRLDPVPEFQVGSSGFQLGEADGITGGFTVKGHPGQKPEAGTGPKNDKIRFAFTAAPKPRLTIYTPEVKPPSDAQSPGAGDDPQAKALAAMMMKQMLDGMLMEFRVRLNGRLSETNATYSRRSTSEIGLYRMDFGNLVKNQAALEKLLSIGPAADAATVKKALQDPLLAPYLKLETKERVDAAFE